MFCLSEYIYNNMSLTSLISGAAVVIELAAGLKNILRYY